MSETTPAVPLPSSTVLLLRDAAPGDAPFSVLMIGRHKSVAFPGVHAFPGGVVEAADADAPASLPADQRWPSEDLGDTPPGALRYWVAAVRELFEEVGILLAEQSGRPLLGPLPGPLQELRVRLHAGEPFGPLLAEHGLTPSTHTLYNFARWITPRSNPRRWDTRFLVGRLPAGQDAVVDGTETVSATWYTPRAALAAYDAGTIDLMPPTVRTLDELAAFPSIDGVLADARSRVVCAASPDIVVDGPEPTMTYPPNTGHETRRPRTLVLRGGRWRPLT